jgi:hypothetical protein
VKAQNTLAFFRAADDEITAEEEKQSAVNAAKS